MEAIVRRDLGYARICSFRGGADVPGSLAPACSTEKLVVLILVRVERRSTGEKLFEE